VVVREEAGLHHPDVPQPHAPDLHAEQFKHARGDVDGDHVPGHGRHGERELPGACADVDDDRAACQAQPLEEGDLLDGAGVLLTVVARHVIGVEVLSPSAGNLVKKPPRQRLSGGAAVTPPSCRRCPARRSSTGTTRALNVVASSCFSCGFVR